MDFKWIGSKVECYSDSPLLPKGYSEFYTSFSYNGEEFRVGEFALFKHIKKSDLTKVGRLLCVFQSFERNIKHNGIVRWYSWARNMQHKLPKFDEKNEIIEETPNSDTCVSLKDILKKCLVVCATLDEPVHLIKKYNLNPDVYFSCRYKMERDQLLPYFSEDAMKDTANSDYVVGCNLNEKLNRKLGSADTSQDSDSSMEEETDLTKHIQGKKSTVVTDSSPLTKTTPIKITKPIYNKRKTSCTGSVISLSSEGSDLDDVHVKVTSPTNPSKNLKLTPRSCGRGSYSSPLDNKLSVKRVLNDSFEDPPASPIFTYSIINSNCNDPKQLKMKFKLTEAEPGVHLKIYPTILDDEIVHMKTSIKIKDLQEVKNRVEFSPDAKAKMSEIACETDTPRRRRAKAQTGSPYTPAQIGSTRRRSSRIIQRQSYAEYCSPEENTPRTRVRRPSTDSHRSLALKTPLTETKKIILSKIDENGGVNHAHNEKNSPGKVSNHSICDNIQINGDNGTIKNIHKSASKTQRSTSEYSKTRTISVDSSSSDESDSSTKSKEITLGIKHRLLERLKNNKGNATSNQDIEKDNSNEKLVVTTSRPKRNVGTPKRYINDDNSKIEKSIRSSRHLKNDSHVHDDEDNVNSSKLKCSVGRPKRYITDDECDNRNYKLDTKSPTIKNTDDGTTLSTKSSRIKRNVGRPKKYRESDNSDDDTRKKDKSSIKSNHKTPSKNPYTTAKPGSRSAHKNVQKASAYTESDDDNALEPSTPKAQRQKITACTPRSVMKDTPSARARMVREGMITPSVQARNKAVLKENTPLSKARTQLHVSFVPKALPCREKEFADIINFLEGKLLDGCGGCDKCSRHFSRSDALYRHRIQTCLQPNNRANAVIGDAGGGPSAAKKSKRNTPNEVATSPTRYCDVCDENVPRTAYVGHVRSDRHTARCSTVAVGEGVEALQSAFQCRIASYRVTSENHHINVVEYMGELKNKVVPLMECQLSKFKSVKCNLVLAGYFILEAKGLSDVKTFNTRNEIVTLGNDVNQVYDDFTGILDGKVSEFQERESGWALKHLLHLDVNINKYNPLRASSYIPLPKEIQRKMAVVNVQNQDEYCFGWAIMASIVKAQGGRPERISSYPDCRQFLVFNDIEVPVRLRDISKFEKYNPQLSINVYGLEKVFQNNVTKYEIVGPLYYTSSKDRAHHINLLLYTNEEGNSHYCYIENFSRLVSQQITFRDGAKHFCDGCLHYFRTAQQLQQHQQFDCNHVYTKLPSTDLVTDRLGKQVPQNILKFDNYHKQMKVPFVIYADFETILKPVSTVEPQPSKTFTVTTCEHQPHSFAYYMKCSYDDSLSKFEIYRGENVVEVFMQSLERDIRNVYSAHLKHIVPMNALTLEEIQNFEDAVACHICNLPFEDRDIRVREHDHLTGDYRGPAHSICNLNYNIPEFIPIFFHNLNYDSHLFVKQLALNKENIDVIPHNKEKYISFGKQLLVDEITREDGKKTKIYMKMRFLDSYRFMSCSLAKLAENLSADQCVEIQKHFGNGVEFDLMRQKGVFPYSYVDSFAKLDQPSLPTMEQFYDPLNDEHITQPDYDRAVEVWRTFDCHTLGDYSDTYLKSDVLILTDVFENFRALCLHHYKVDPAHYYTSPGLSWDAMLKYSGVQLELLTDMDMLHFFRKGIRGGVSTCVGRKAVANNAFAGNFDPSKPTSFIMYLDATNLYGYAMREFLPEGNFVWLTDEERESFNVFDVSDESDTGYVLEVDLHYPEDLHDDHNDFPFCPELLVPPNGKFKTAKLIPNLFDKSKYIIHYRNLRQCLEAGLELTKTYRILKFRQSPWLRSYIDLNTKLRNQSKTEFEKSFFKGLNNSVFGKTMENVDKRVNVKLLSHWEKHGHRLGAENFISQPSFKDLVKFGENLVAVEMNRTSVYYNKPCYVGFSVLDISKTVMYDFYYNFLKTQYGNNISLLYTDTDSLVLEIFTDNFYHDMKEHLHRYDTANFKTNLYGIPRTESVVGKMKDEYAGVPIKSFYGTGAKTYCVNVGDKLDRKAKGVKKSSVEKQLTAELFQQVAENQQSSVVCRMYVFRSRLHTVYTELVNKVALSSYDDKRYLIPGTTKTLAWGHRDISSRDADNRLNELVELLEAADPV